MKSKFKRLWNLSNYLFNYFHQGWKYKAFSSYLKVFLALSLEQVYQLLTNLLEIQKYNKERIAKLATTTKGLYALLPPDATYTYSILISLDNPSPLLLKSCLQSVCKQAASVFEILIGYDKQPTHAIMEIIEAVKQEFPNRISQYQCQSNEEPLNVLAQKAKGNFLLFIDQEDWIRPDLLFRYEQTLRALSNPLQSVIYCDENSITPNDHFIPNSTVKKPKIHFPYYFEGDFHERGCLIPKILWEKVQGISNTYLGAEIDDLILRLDIAGATLHCIPLSLYSRRIGNRKTTRITTRKALLQALDAYTKAKKLHWSWDDGFRPHDVRAIPAILNEHQVQVIIPFKDQKKLTIDCIHSVLKQKGVKIRITAVDNGSLDTSISQELRKFGVEVLTINEPFNYSRLNNLALKETKTAQDCDLVLFLNNDVELHADAICEMVRWIDQPHIGIVGCRLHYPDGRLQHGGVSLDNHSSPNTMKWDHRETFSHFDAMQQTKVLGIVDAVTAACALVKRGIFLEVGGFDEIWYPIAFSDTNLALKLKLKGLMSFYTPYASGIHHESVSRQGGIEDFESSKWLHNLLRERSQ